MNLSQAAVMAVFSLSGGLGWPRWRAQTHCPLPMIAPSRGRPCSCPTFPRSRASWLASEGRIALWARCEQHQAAGFPAGTGRHGRLYLSDCAVSPHKREGGRISPVGLYGATSALSLNIARPALVEDQ